jgi:hypothetical protein
MITPSSLQEETSMHISAPSKLIRLLILSGVITGVGLPSAGHAQAMHTINMNVSGGENKTVLLVSQEGTIQASADVTSDSQSISLVTDDNVHSLKGSTLQIVTRGTSSSDPAAGQYFGSVVLNWKGTKSDKAGEIYTVFKDNGTDYTIDLGDVAIVEIDSESAQGYGILAAKSAYADMTLKVKASKGIPAGTKAAGKAASNSPKSSDSKPSITALPGRDYDLDGVPNLFDVDDDNDGLLDNLDRRNPKLSPLPEGTLCSAKDFRIFTNLKATDPDLSRTINFYGTGSHKADDTRISQALTDMLVYVFQPITSVCGSNSVKYEIKGTGVPYAPSIYTEMFSNTQTNDIQWMVGSGLNQGQPSNIAVTAPYTFTSPTEISGTDTFMERVTTAAGTSFEYAATPNFVFVTHPMLESYKVGAAPKVTVDYASAAPDSSAANRIQLANGEKITVNIYRPQRLGLAGEPARYYDIGQMSYYFDIPNGPNGIGAGPGRCDSQVKVDSAFFDTPVVIGSMRPKPKLSMTVNVDKCFADRGMTWSGGTLDIDIQVASANGGNSAQKLFLNRP